MFVPLVPSAPAVPKIAVPAQKEQFPHREKEQGKGFSKVSLRIWDGEVIPCKTLHGDGGTKPPLEAAQIYLGRVFPLINRGGVCMCWERH